MTDLPELTLPPRLDDWVYRYYFTDEYPFGRRPSRHVRERRLQEIARWLGDRAPGRALDVGCGPAEMSAVLCRRFGPGCEVVSLDLGPSFAPLARTIVEANGGRFRFLVGNAVRLPLQPASFDLVITMEMIEHVPRWREFLAEAARVLQPGGRLIVSTPTRAGFHSWLKRAWQALTGWEKVNQACLRGEGTDYERFLAREEVVAAAAMAGLALEAVKVKIFVFSFIPRPLFGLNRLAEAALERTPGLRELGVCRFYLFRKRG
jgi:SAM-dependent methyltransferase